MSNVERVRRGFLMNGPCPMCQNDSKDVTHIFK